MKIRSNQRSKTMKMKVQDATIRTMQCQFTDEHGELQPGPFTVQFNVQPPHVKAVGDSNYVRAQAQINWVVDGNSVTRIVDIGNGASVSGTGESVSIIVTDHTGSNGADPALEYTISVQVAPGTHASQNKPPTLILTNPINAANVTPGTPLNLPIPENAGAISVYVIASTNGVFHEPRGDIFIQQLTTGGNVIAVSEYIEEFIPLQSGCASLEIQSRTNNYFVAVMLGIDG